MLNGNVGFSVHHLMDLEVSAPVAKTLSQEHVPFVVSGHFGLGE